MSKIGLKLRLAKRDGQWCHYCEKQKPLDKLTFDHKNPKSKGGSLGEENIVLACRPCNTMKADMSYEEFYKRTWIGCKPWPRERRKWRRATICWHKDTDPCFHDCHTLVSYEAE